MGPSVPGVALASHQVALFEFVDQADHDVAMHAHRVGELLLTEPLLAGELHQHAVMRGLKTYRLQDLGTPDCDVKAELGQQKCPACAQHRGRLIFGHFEIVSHHYHH